MRKMVWNVYIENFNKKEIETYNIFDHASFYGGVKKAYQKCKDDFNAFETKVMRELMYYFWSKCEWEIILSDWPPSDKFRDKKVSVYDQVMLNWDTFIHYVWDTAHAMKKSDW